MPRKSGFLLIEMIVAFSVVAISLGAILQVISHSLKNANAARKLQEAAYLAEEKMWEGLWQEPITEGWDNGDFSEHTGMSWSREITLLHRPSLEELEEDRATVQGASHIREKLPPTDLFQIRVYVNWVEQGKKKNFELATYRLAPTPDEFDDQTAL